MAREDKLRGDFALAAEALSQEAARRTGHPAIIDDVERGPPRGRSGGSVAKDTEVLSHVRSEQSGERQREGEISEREHRLYAVWQTSRHFCEPRLKPWAVSSSLSKLEAWARANIPVLGSKRFFFAQKVGPTEDLADARWSVLCYLYKNGIKAVRKDPRDLRRRS